VRRRRILLDLALFKESPGFRLLWSGYLITVLGNQLTVVAVPFQVYTLTHSSFDVGLVSLVQLGPLLVGSLYGGAIADSLDRRRLLIVAQLFLASTSLGLALNASGGHPSLWPLFVCSGASAGFSGIDGPTRAALITDIVARPSLVQANALWQALYTTGQVAGPALGGVLLGRVGVAPVYWIDMATYGFALACLVALRTARTAHTATGDGRGRFGISSLAGGLSYLRGHRVLQGVFLIDMNAMIFGMPRALFPALGLAHFHGGAGTVGLLYAAPGVGGLTGAVFTGWTSAIRRQGLAVLVAVAIWGAAITGFGLVHVLWIALALLAVAGGADIVSAIFRSTMLQLLTPGSLRGRLQAVQSAVVTGGPRLGDLESGAVASLAGPVTSVVSGGIACLVGVVVLAKALPGFARARVATHLEDHGGDVATPLGGPEAPAVALAGGEAGAAPASPDVQR
jgi:hypothetical protein